MRMNRMDDFFSKNYGVIVHVDFIDFKGNLTSTVGKLSQEEREKTDGEIETFAIVESDTDLNVIPIVDIKKIFVKKD